MEALFIIPALVSDKVDPKMVPALAKSIERNIILTYHSTIRVALYRRYGHSSYTREAYNLFEAGKTKAQITPNVGISPSSLNLPKINVSLPKIGSDNKKQADQGELAYTSSKPHSVAAKDNIEYPKGIYFYHMVGLEPTYLQVPLRMKTSNFLGGDEIERILTVGFKCVPYTMKNVNDLLALATDMKGRSVVKNWFTKKFNNLKTKIPFTVPQRIRSGERGGDMSSIIYSDRRIKYSGDLDIVFAPNSELLANPRYLQKHMGKRTPTSWSTLTIFSNSDFPSEKSLKEHIGSYRDLVKAGWGDMIVMNEMTDTAYFCTQSSLACYEMSTQYMKSTMNIDNVIDERDIRGFTKSPFRVKPLRSVFESSGSDPDNVIFKMNQIIRGL